MTKTNNVTNDCQYCIHCLKHFVKVNGEYHAVDEKLQCCNKEMTPQQIKERTENKVVCEYFSLEPSTELENISYALCGIMSELCEIKTILKKQKISAPAE